MKKIKRIFIIAIETINDKDVAYGLAWDSKYNEIHWEFDITNDTLKIHAGVVDEKAFRLLLLQYLVKQEDAIAAGTYEYSDFRIKTAYELADNYDIRK